MMIMSGHRAGENYSRKPRNPAKAHSVFVTMELKAATGPNRSNDAEFNA